MYIYCTKTEINSKVFVVGRGQKSCDARAVLVRTNKTDQSDGLGPLKMRGDTTFNDLKIFGGWYLKGPPTFHKSQPLRF